MALGEKRQERINIEKITKALNPDFGFEIGALAGTNVAFGIVDHKKEIKHTEDDIACIDC